MRTLKSYPFEIILDLGDVSTGPRWGAVESPARPRGAWRHAFHPSSCLPAECRAATSALGQRTALSWRPGCRAGTVRQCASGGGSALATRQPCVNIARPASSGRWFWVCFGIKAPLEVTDVFLLGVSQVARKLRGGCPGLSPAGAVGDGCETGGSVTACDSPGQRRSHLHGPRAAACPAGFPALGRAWRQAALAVTLGPRVGHAREAWPAEAHRARPAGAGASVHLLVSVLRTALQGTEASDGLRPEGEPCSLWCKTGTSQHCAASARHCPTQPCCPVLGRGAPGRSLLPREPSARSPSPPGGCRWAWACQPQGGGGHGSSSSCRRPKLLSFSCLPSLPPPSPFVPGLGGEGRKAGTSPFRQRNPGGVPSPPAGARGVSPQLLLLAPPVEQVTR